MILHVKVKPHSGEEKIEQISETEYIISVKETAENNKANIKLINLLAKHLKIPYKKIKIKNPTSRNKIIEIKE